MDNITKYRVVEKLSLGAAFIFTAYLMIINIIASENKLPDLLHLYVVSPYIIFYIFSYKINKTYNSPTIKATSITSVIVLLITLLVYIDALYIHTSSTSVLIFLFLPIYIIIGSIIIFAIIQYVIAKVVNSAL